jgi:hypothetical protein
MQRLSLADFAIPLSLISIGFIFMGAIGWAMSPKWLNDAGIRELAKKNVSAPTLPPKPLGETVTQIEKKQICTNVPEVRLKGLMPTVVNRQVCNNVEIPKSQFVSPDTSQTRDWEEQAAAIQTEYDRKVQEEADRISERQRADLKDFIKDMIQIAAGILGLIASAIALLPARRRRMQ